MFRLCVIGALLVDAEPLPDIDTNKNFNSEVGDPSSFEYRFTSTGRDAS
jgi:hypothetical protein